LSWWLFDTLRNRVVSIWSGRYFLRWRRVLCGEGWNYSVSWQGPHVTINSTRGCCWNWSERGGRL